MLTEAKLPYRNGYVEVEHEDGSRSYQQILDNHAILTFQLQAENIMLQAKLQLEADRMSFLEDCLAEVAAEVYTTDKIGKV